jgi:hypothetical protein
MGEAEKARTKDRAYAAGIATALTTGIHWFKDHIF